MKTEITLPIELYKLGLDEIGAIFILMASPHMEEKYKKYWEDNYGFKKVLEILKKDEIVSLDENNKLNIDLTWV